MDCCVSYKNIPETLPIVVKSQSGRRDQKVFNKFGFTKTISPSQSIIKVSSKSEFRLPIEQTTRRRGKPLFAVVGDTGLCKEESVETPLEPRTCAGNLLSVVLQKHRHLFHFAVAKQLDQLASDRDGAVASIQRSSSSTESFLQRRIAEMKESECQMAVEDVMYMLIVHKFSEMDVPMVPRLSECMSNKKLALSLSNCKEELESVHSFEAREMIREHLARIIFSRGGNQMNKTSTIKIQRLQLGRIYAASVMYGYFLKSANLRHQLESSFAQTHESFSLEHGIHVPLTECQSHRLKDVGVLSQSNDRQATSLCQETRPSCKKMGRLRNYVMGFTADTLQRCAKLKSKEAVNLVEKHTWALFGDEKIGELDADDEIVVTISSLERLVLEAVAFGSFLWDVERYVDSVYRLKDH